MFKPTIYMRENAMHVERLRRKQHEEKLKNENEEVVDPKSKSKSP